MVAAGAAALMTASESSSSKSNDGVTSQYEAQNAQRSVDGQGKKTVKNEKKNSVRSPSGGKAVPIRETKASRLRAASIVSPTEGTPVSRRSTTVETLPLLGHQIATSSLRKPKSSMSSSNRATAPGCVTRERDKTAKRTSVSIKSPEAEEKCIAELTSHRVTSADERSERTRIMRRTSSKQSSSSKTERLNDNNGTHDPAARRADIQHQSTGLSTTSRASSAIASSSGMKLRSSTQRTSSAIVGAENSEVLRRVDALTALTRATMERVERLTSHSSPTVNGKSRLTGGNSSGEHHTGACSSTATSSKNSIVTKRGSRHVDNQDSTSARGTDATKTLIGKANNSNGEQASEAPVETSVTSSRQKIRQPPISILKHNKCSTENSDASGSCGGYSSRILVQATNVLQTSLIDKLTKRHGILKKRSSLDDNEILRRRRSCSPDTVYPEINGAEFKPILKHERRSSLDDLVKRSDSPDNQNQPHHHHQHHHHHHHHHHQSQTHHPPSILKRKSLGDEDRDDSQACASEPTSILKRSSGNSSKNSGIGHHVSIAAAVAKTLGYATELANGSEVRPILKKKFSREESSSSEPPSLEPRPILKKKSSTDSDEHDERPKTILKSSRKSSQEDSGNEIDAASPKKLSMLKNRSIQRRTNSLPECDVVRPILKQSSSRESSSPSRSSLSGNASPGDSFSLATKDLFLRKRARSLGHMQSSSNEAEDWLRAEARQERANFSIIPNDRNPNQNVTSPRSNECTNTATASNTTTTTITTTITTTTTTTTAATSSIAPIVSFKLPSRHEMNNRYEVDDDEYPSISDGGTNPGCPNFRYNCEEQGSEEEDDNAKRLTSTQSSGRRSDRWNSRIVSSDSLLSIVQQKSRCASTGAKMEDSRENRGASRGVKETSDGEKFVPAAENGSKVSRIAQHFKILEEQMRSNENPAERRGIAQKHGRDARDQLRYDRFNTQPITYEEVREAVLQNQRKAATAEFHGNNRSSELERETSDIEPSKLSLADRVRLFNRRIATESVAKVVGMSSERSQRRRPANRYKTQPVTSEEVEVASRIFPSEKQEGNATESDSDEYTGVISSVRLLPQTSSNVTPPRSILKYSSQTSQTANEGGRAHRARDSPRKETDTAGIIDEAYLLSSELKLTRKEFNTRRLQRRKRNGELDTATRDESGTVKSVHKAESADDNFHSNYAALEHPANNEVLYSSYDKIVSHDNTDGSEIRDGYDIADNVDTATNASLFTRQRAIQRATTIEKMYSLTESDSVSFVRRDKQHGDMQQIDFPSITIADRLAALQRSGTTDWKRRVNAETVIASSNVVKCSNNDTAAVETASQAERDEFATKQRKLAERLEKLESATEGWRKRVAVTDAVKFSVAGKMRVEQQVDNPDQLSPLVEVAAGNASDGKKKTPRPERFRSCRLAKDTTNVACNFEEANEIRDGSSGSVSEESDDEAKSTRQPSTISSVPRADDETFTSFFSNISFAKCEAETLDFPESDFDVVTSFSQRLGTRRTVKTQRRRLPSKNPLRTLAARTDLKDEYTEITTGVAERVMRTLNVEKLAKKSSLAVEALAGLASTEDFGAVTLKNVDADATGYGNRLPPHKDVMLILVKGRRHVQIRLVEPVVASINSGDNFILVTKNELYNYVGKYSNVIERARGAEIALSIQQNRDLGCRASQVITISEEKPTCTSNQVASFWKILGADTRHSVEVTDAGHPDEDELYESALLDTNMVYEVVGEDELLPLDSYWGAMPKIEMLDPSKILVFDFGSEMYVWNGKIAPSEKKKVATQLAEELWQEGYDYSECTVSPINAASIIGRRARLENNVKKDSSRPEWCLIGKLTQHMETVLFREKFLDWPNVSGIIRVKESREKEHTDGKIVIEPPDVDVMIDSESPVVDMILEGSHLGRGKGWYDDELMRQFVVATTNVTVWHIDEFSYSLLSDSSIGQFYTGDSYIVRWMYTVTVTGRGLSGEPSKHASKGRDRCAYFIWQGRKASLNEQGTAALLTVEFDREQGPQIRVPEGFEPAAFLNLFSGRMVVHNGKNTRKKWRMYICRGSEETETSLTEVPCSTRQLRSRGSLLLLNTIAGKIYVWHGRAALPHLKQNALRAANILRKNRPEEAGLSGHVDVTICEVNESDEEPASFFEALGGMNKQLYVPVQGNTELNHTPRLFHLSSVSGEFAATELLCPHRSDLATPFPFLQDELYQVNQPALFLLDNKDKLWLWQGWWPDTGSEDQTGSGAVRWQAERRAAMIAAMRYWEKLNPGSEDCPVYLVWAGLEPLEFTNLFPTWNYRDESAELNIRDGRDSGEVLTVEGELARLTQSTYPIAQLLQRPLPDGVDPTILEKYLSPQHFEELLGMNIEEFQRLPAWKQINVKKKIGLF